MFAARLFAVSIAAFALIQQQATASSPEDIANAFKSSCLTEGKSIQKLQAQLQNSGWKDVSRNPPQEMLKLIAIFEQAKKKMQADSGFDQEVLFSKRTGDRSLFAWLASFHVGEARSVSCSVYDFAGTNEEFLNISLAELADQPPERDEKFGVTVLKWKNPSRLKGYYAVKATYVSPDSRAAPMLGFNGISMTTSAREEE